MTNSPAPTDTGRTLAIGSSVRAALGGALMGLANLVPGVSGGTMLLAAGVYQRFIDAIADVVRLKPRPSSLVTLALVVGAAGIAIVSLAGPVKTLVIEHRWVMYSVFVGLTLGGVPIVYRLAKPIRPPTVAGAIAGFVGMAALAVVQSRVGAGGGANDSVAFMMLAGLAGASAMILPGVSGGYLLLVLGVYVPILASIDRLKNAASEGDLGAVVGEWDVVVPVGVGVTVGVVGVSQVLRWLLHRHSAPTLGVLLGLLIGAVAGLWPFQASVEPEVGSTLKGQVVTAIETRGDRVGGAERLAITATDEIGVEDWPTAFFAPGAGQIAASLALVGAGFGATFALGLLDRGKPERRTNSTGRDTPASGEDVVA